VIEWHDVSVGPAPQDEDVLVYMIDGSHAVAYWSARRLEWVVSAGVWTTHDEYLFLSEQVTHWAPLDGPTNVVTHEQNMR